MRGRIQKQQDGFPGKGNSNGCAPRSAHLFSPFLRLHPNRRTNESWLPPLPPPPPPPTPVPIDVELMSPSCHHPQPHLHHHHHHPYPQIECELPDTGSTSSAFFTRIPTKRNYYLGCEQSRDCFYRLQASLLTTRKMSDKS